METLIFPDREGRGSLRREDTGGREVLYSTYCLCERDIGHSVMKVPNMGRRSCRCLCPGKTLSKSLVI
jgi:hypothetical protein